jgi:hypothetical protein
MLNGNFFLPSKYQLNGVIKSFPFHFPYAFYDYDTLKYKIG